MTKLTISFITGALAAGALVAGAAPRTFTGVVTDSMCGANHESMKIAPDSKCVVECAKHGSKYALFDGKDLWVFADQKTPEQFAGRKVRVTGTLFEKTKILKADSIVADGKADAQPPAPPRADHSAHKH